MATTLPVSAVSLNYECPKCDTAYDQPLADVTEVGTMICPECGDDMDIKSATIL